MGTVGDLKGMRVQRLARQPLGRLSQRPNGYVLSRFLKLKSEFADNEVCHSVSRLQASS
jgi:hypothetical protein